MKEKILTAIASAAGVGLLWWIVAKLRTLFDRHKAYRWLRSNTQDEPSKSHVTTEAIAKGTRLTEDRIKRACMSDKRINYFEGQPGLWSIWRKEPQYTYEKRGMLSL